MGYKVIGRFTACQGVLHEQPGESGTAGPCTDMRELDDYSSAAQQPKCSQSNQTAC